MTYEVWTWYWFQNLSPVWYEYAMALGHELIAHEQMMECHWIWWTCTNLRSGDSAK